MKFPQDFDWTDIMNYLECWVREFDDEKEITFSKADIREMVELYYMHIGKPNPW